MQPYTLASLGHITGWEGICTWGEGCARSAHAAGPWNGKVEHLWVPTSLQITSPVARHGSWSGGGLIIVHLSCCCWPDHAPLDWLATAVGGSCMQAALLNSGEHRVQAGPGGV